MSTELEQIKREMLELVSKDVDADSAETISWMERAANLVYKEELLPGQVWRYKAEEGLKKEWIS